jgi:hypothetical protein
MGLLGGADSTVWDVDNTGSKRQVPVEELVISNI